MPHPSVACPDGLDPAELSRAIHRAHERYLRTGTPGDDVRPVVRDSWRRSVLAGVDPWHARPPVELVDAELDDYRTQHLMAHTVPVIRHLLLSDVMADGLIVAIGDAEGRLLWVEGDKGLRSRAAGDMRFVEGANWSERHAGTNALGTAVATDESVQIFTSEHFRYAVHQWSCSAAPVHDPAGALVGFVNVTGHRSAASPQMLMVVRAAAVAAEAELRLAAHGRAEAAPLLKVLGRDNAVLVLPSMREIRLSPRHSELLLILALHPEGLTADELAVRLFTRDCSPVTVRAEMTRLRRILGENMLVSRPYRLTSMVETDVGRMQNLLERGAHRRALAMYRGPVLPRSEAPDIAVLRETVRSSLRDALIRHANLDVLFAYAQSPDGRYDLEAWQACRDRLPFGSPKRTQVESHLRFLQRELR